jgi:hypothetical protein
MNFRFLFERFTLILCSTVLVNIFLAVLGTRNDYLPLRLLAYLLTLQVDLATWLGKWLGTLVGFIISILVPPTVQSLDTIGDIFRLTIATLVSFLLAIQQALGEYQVAQILTSNMFLLGGMLLAGFVGVFYIGLRQFIPFVHRTLAQVVDAFAPLPVPLPVQVKGKVSSASGRTTTTAAAATKVKDS